MPSEYQEVHNKPAAPKYGAEEEFERQHEAMVRLGSSNVEIIQQSQAIGLKTEKHPAKRAEAVKLPTHEREEGNNKRELEFQHTQNAKDSI